MHHGLRRFILLVLLLTIAVLSGTRAHAREITDMAGRKVTIPDVIHKVFSTSPPATYMTYTFNPDLIAGLNSPPKEWEKKYFSPKLCKLPVVGGWFGQGNVANLETVLQVKPDIIVAWMQSGSPTNDKIEQSLKPLGIPMVYVRTDTLADYPAAFRFLGDLFGCRDRGEMLAAYAEEILRETTAVVGRIPASDRVPVYYAEGADGLSTECNVSWHVQLISLSGGVNVHQCEELGGKGMQKVSMEQVLRYDPQVILAHEPLFFTMLAESPTWQNLRAVREGRVYRIPREPFNWFDRPPSFMRLLGLKWLINRLHPEVYPVDMVAETKKFYRLFLNVSLDDAAVRELLGP